MKKINYFLALMLTLFIASCVNSGNSDNPNEIKLELETDLGGLGEFLTVDGDEVMIKLDSIGGNITLASSIGVNVNKAVAAKYSGDLDLKAEILDKNHISISSFPRFELETSRVNDNEDFDHVLFPGKKWAMVKSTQESWSEEDQKQWEKIKKEGAYLRITCRGKEYKPYTNTTNETSETPDTNDSDRNIDSDTENEDVVSSSSDSEDWDAVLNSYDKYVDQYISLLKKAKNGDMNALTEYPALMEKAQNLSDKMANAKDNMSPSQWAKYNKITMKMAKAAEELR